MPSNLLQADVGFPQFKEEQKPDEKINVVVNYLYMLLEQLRYSFGNIGLENFSDGGLMDLMGVITKPINIRLEDDEGRINDTMILAEGLFTRLQTAEGEITQLNATAQGLTGRISDAEGNITTLTATTEGLDTRVSSAEGDISSLSLTAAGLATRVTDAEGNISTLTQTANGLTTRVSAAEGNITTVTQTANGLYTEVWGSPAGSTSRISQNASAIQTKVSSGDVSTMITQFANGLTLSASNGSSQSTLSLKSGSTTLSSAAIKITGMVTFTDLSTSGSSTINGGNITTGTIAAVNVGVTGAFSVSNGETNGGYMGYITTPAGNYGVGVKHKTNSGGALYVTNNGAKITSGSSEQGQVYVYNTAVYFKAYDSTNAQSRSMYFAATENCLYPSPSMDLGKSGSPWKDIYISGHVYQNGTQVL